MHDKELDADINAETIFFTCERKIPELFITIQKIIKDFKT